MMKMKTIGLVGALGFALVGSSVSGQGAAADPAPSAPLATQQSAGGKPSDKPDQDKGKGQDNKSDPSNRPDKPNSKGYPDDIKKMLDDIKKAETKFLEEQTELRGQLNKATKEKKDQIRLELREKREKFLEQQKEMREEFRKRVNEIREKLKDHRDVIDDAKENSRDKVRQRKGGDD